MCFQYSNLLYITVQLLHYKHATVKYNFKVASALITINAGIILIVGFLDLQETLVRQLPGLPGQFLHPCYMPSVHTNYK